MKINKKIITGSFWFSLEVIGIFLLIQIIRFAIGNLDAIYCGLSIVLVALLLFLAAVFVAKYRDRQSRKTGKKIYMKMFIW